jgi:hypothetical protein
MMPAPTGVAGAAAGAGTEDEAPPSAPRLYPHEAQKRLPALTCPHWGQGTPAPGGGTEAVTAGGMLDVTTGGATGAGGGAETGGGGAATGAGAAAGETP